MRPFGTSDQLARRRQRALDLLRRGQTPAQVAEHFGTTERSVRRWRLEAQHPKRKRTGRGPGHPRHLSETQLRQLGRALQRGAYAHGYAEDYWTLDRIARLIWDLFAVCYTPSGVWHLMHYLGWSSQKPQRRPLQRDDEAITAWTLQDWPRIKKVA